MSGVLAVGMNTDGNIKSKTVISMTRMFNMNEPLFRSRLIMVDGGCADFAGSRNKLVDTFLQTGIDWLMIVDADMVWTQRDFINLFTFADPDAVNAGLYFVDGTPPRPCAAIIDKDGNVSLPDVITPKVLLRVSAAGLGFSVTHRTVWEKTRGEGDHPWFQHGWQTPKGETMPEDYAFAWRCQEAGVPILLNTEVRPGHIKDRTIGWEDYASG